MLRAGRERTQHIRVLEDVQCGEDIEAGGGVDMREEARELHGRPCEPCPRDGIGCDVKHKTKPLNEFNWTVTAPVRISTKSTQGQ